MSFVDICNTSVLVSLEEPEEWDAVDRGLSAHLPHSAYALNAFRLNRQYFRDSTFFFRSLELPRDSGFMLLAYRYEGRDVLEVVAFCPESNLDIWRKVLESLNWKSPIIFNACVLPMEKIVVEVCRGRVQRLPPKETPNSVYVCTSIDELNDIEHPGIVSVGQLMINDIPKLFENWPYRDETVPDIMSETVKVGFGVGARLVESGELVSWCVQYRCGPQGALMTDTNHLRKGYAKCVIRELTKQTLAKKLVPVVSIVDGNVQSVNLYESLGYRRIGNNIWFMASGDFA